MLALTMTRVSRSSLTILAMRDFLMYGLAKTMPLGETAKGGKVGSGRQARQGARATYR